MAERAVDVLLIGGGVAALRCARTLRRHGFGGSILLVGEERHPPYNRPPLSKELLRAEVPAELVAAEAKEWYARRGVELLLGMAATSLDPGERLVTLANGTRLRFGTCLLATGAAPRRPDQAGGQDVVLLRTLDDAIALRLGAVAGRRATVVGGGFIGVEVASALRTRGVSVTLLARSTSLWGGSLGGALSDWAVKALERSGIDVRLGVDMAGAQPATELIVGGIGVTPRTELAAGAGIEIGDGILVDECYATSAAHVFAAGDVAAAPLPLADGAHVRIEHWHAAREAGEAAALGMLGAPAATRRAPWLFSEVAGLGLDVIGWAPAWDDEIILGSPERDRFAVVQLRAGRAAQVAVVGGMIPIEPLRVLVERRPTLAEVRDLFV